ncbi:MAG: dihydrolipoamide succinyltransferase, partial [Parvularculaceae bacterium]|nr:dihydrolipoamide succinyltransferase [Parvularculaceae bacterium]
MPSEIRVPTLGESVTEATIGRWLKKVGDAVRADEPLVELETDKVSVEVPSPASGVLSEIVAKEGATVGLNAVLGSVTEGAADAKPAAKNGKAEPAKAPAVKAAPEPAAAPALSPAPRRVLAEAGVD